MAYSTHNSIEEQVEDWCKQQLGIGNYYTKTQEINQEISAALRKAPSKKGGEGKNFPDIQCLIQSPNMDRIPVMIEVKGKQGDFIKTGDDGEILNVNAKGEPLYNNIAKYAVNGALHYAHAIINFTESFHSVIAIGVNGYPLHTGEIQYEIGAYFVSKQNLFLPKRIGDFSDLSFLQESYRNDLFATIEKIQLTEAEIEKRKLQLEDDIERNLKEINQKIHDEQNIVVGSRVKLIAGLVMAGLGVPNHVSPLMVEELRGEMGEHTRWRSYHATNFGLSKP